MEQCRAAGLRVNEIKVKIQADAHAAHREQVRRPASYDTEAASRQIEKLAARTINGELKKSLEKLSRRIRENHRDE